VFGSTSRILCRIIGIAGAIVTARLLGPEGYGLLGIVFALTLTFDALVDTGVEKAVVHYASGEPDDSQIVWSGFVLDFSLTVFVFIINLLFVGWFEAQTHKPIKILSILAALYLLPSAFDVWKARLSAKRRVELLSGISVTANIMQTSLSIGLIVIGFGVQGAIIGYVIARTCSTLLCLRYGFGRGEFSVMMIKKMLSYGLPSGIKGLAIYTVRRIDRLILAFFVTAADIAIYGIANMIGSMIQLLPASFSLVMLPYISEAYKNNDITKIHGSYSAGLVIFSLWGILSSIFVILLARPLVLFVLGTEYLPSLSILRICIFADVAHGVFYVMLTTLDGINQTMTNLIITVIQSLVTISFLFLLVPSYGIRGAAYIDVIVSLIGAVLGFFCVKRITGLNIKQNLGYINELIILFKRSVLK